ncbi:MAG TPA: SDR family NAD(P)-dependent oxidoreductase [Puia sp.]|nr:SDR family NAD(P)-dependent oxidoreductase [Puia sp.]
MQLTGNKILITGGGSGIGRGLTERFLEEQNTVIICGRRKELLDELAKEHPGLITRTCDLERPVDRESLFAWIQKEHPDLNILVNNAGIQNWVAVTDKDFFARSRQEIAINVEAPLHLTSLFIQLPALKTIMNVTSGLSFSPLSKVPVYCATKAFFHSFTLSLRHLLAPKGIEVIEIIPPALNTDLGGKGIHDGQPPVGDFIAAIFQQLQQGKNELTFGFSEQMTKAGPDQLRQAFARMNS